MASDPGLASRERLQRPGTRIAFVVSNFHRDLTSAMLESAREELAASGVPESDTEVAWVPGSFELPLVARRFARREDVDGVICIGLVLKGETTHDLHVAQGATRGIQQVMLETDKPVLFGVLINNTTFAAVLPSTVLLLFHLLFSLYSSTCKSTPPQARNPPSKWRACKTQSTPYKKTESAGSMSYKMSTTRTTLYSSKCTATCKTDRQATRKPSTTKHGGIRWLT